MQKKKYCGTAAKRAHQARIPQKQWAEGSERQRRQGPGAGTEQNVTVGWPRKLQEIARRNVGVLVTLGIMAVLLIMIMTVGIVRRWRRLRTRRQRFLASSYLSKRKEIDAADLADDTA